MDRRHLDRAFAASVQAVRRRLGGQAAEAGPRWGDGAAALGQDARALLAASDRFDLASVPEAGRPVRQHRGPSGFVRVLGDRAVGWAGPAGETPPDGCVAVVFADLPRRRVLRLCGRLRGFGGAERPDLAIRLAPDGESARAERYVELRVDGLRWHGLPPCAATRGPPMAAWLHGDPVGHVPPATDFRSTS